MAGLREMRTEGQRRYTLDEIAGYMGVSKPTYLKWERDPESMTVAQAKKLAEYFGCGVEEVLSVPNEVN